MRSIFTLFLFLFFVTPVLASDNAFQSNKTRIIEKMETMGCDLYMSELQEKIKINWRPTFPDKDEKPEKIVLSFNVNRDGSVSSIKIEQSSGIKKYDKAAIAAIEASSPFKPLPLEYRVSSMEVMFTFDLEFLGAPRQISPCDSYKYSEYKPQKKTKNYIIKNDTYGVLDDYIISARRKVMKNWKPEKYFTYSAGKKGNNLCVEVTVNKDGELIDYEIVRSSKHKRAEKMALDAIKKSAPFDPLPNSLNKNLAKFKIVFVY